MSQSFDDSRSSFSVPVDPTQSSAQNKRRSWVLPALIALFLCSVIGWMFTSAVGQAREGARRAWCTCHSGGQIHLALAVYQDSHGSYPPAFIADADGKPIHSWRALLLPYMDRELADLYSFDEPWDGPNNSKLHNRMPRQFRCPSDFDAPEGTTNYVAVVGSKTAWPGAKRRKLADIKDGASATIQLVEVKGLHIPWLEPRDLDFDTMDFEINSPRGPSIGSHHPGGAMVWMVAGDRRFLRNDTPPEKVRALLTVAGGEKSELPW